jgi:hypothetical protein
MANTSRRSILICVSLLTAVIALPATDQLLAQRQSPAEGPWSGQAQCVVVAKFVDYHDEQTHTWRLTGEAPTPAPRGSAQVYYTWPATWIVQGSGRKTWPSREPGGREQTERWTSAHEMKMLLRFTEVGSGTNRLRIGTEGQRGAPLGSLRVTEVSGRTRETSVQQWAFPAIEDSASTTTISGTSTRTYPEGFGVGPAQPPKAITTATCTWSFSRGGAGQISAVTPPTTSTTASSARIGGAAPIGTPSVTQAAGPGLPQAPERISNAAGVPPSAPNAAILNDPARSRAAPAPTNTAPASPPAATSTSTSTGGRIRTFTASAPFVVPASVTTIGVEIWGAGGGGAAGGPGGYGFGNINPAGGVGGGGGGSGSYVRTTLTVTPGATYNVIVGAGGSGGGNGGASEIRQGSTVLASTAGGSGAAGRNGGAGGVSVPATGVIARDGFGGGMGELPPPPRSSDPSGHCTIVPCLVSASGGPGGAGGGPVTGSVVPEGTMGGAGGSGGSSVRTMAANGAMGGSAGPGAPGAAGAAGYVVITW